MYCRVWIYAVFFLDLFLGRQGPSLAIATLDQQSYCDWPSVLSKSLYGGAPCQLGMAPGTFGLMHFPIRIENLLSSHACPVRSQITLVSFKLMIFYLYKILTCSRTPFITISPFSINDCFVIIHLCGTPSSARLQGIHSCTTVINFTL